MCRFSFKIIVLTSIVLFSSCNKIYFRKIKKISTFASSGTSLGRLHDPSEIKTNGTHLYVSETGNNRIQRFDINSHDGIDWWGFDSNSNCGWHTSNEEGSGSFSPEHIDIVNDTLYALNYSSVYKIQISTGILKSIIAFKENSPVEDIAVDTKGNVYFLSDNKVFKYKYNGKFLYVFGGYGTEDNMISGDSPFFVECDNQDNVYVVCDKLIKFTNKGDFDKTIIKDRGFKGSSLCIVGDRMYHNTGKFVEYTTDGKVLKRWGDRNNLHVEYCVNGDRIYSLFSDEIIEWKFRPDK